MTDHDQPAGGPAADGPAPDAARSADPLDLLFSAPAERLGVEEEGEAATRVPLIVTGASPSPPAPPAPVEPAGPPAPAAVPAAAAPLPPPPAADPMPAGIAPSPTGPLWGPRPHPAPVTAPPPPLPLDAPAPSTGVTPATPPVPVRPAASEAHPGPSAGGPPPSAAPPQPPPAPPSGAGSGPSRDPADAPGSDEAPAIPARPSHPRVRRWFGRGGADTGQGPSEAPEAPVPSGSPEPPARPSPAPSPPPSADAPPFEGAPQPDPGPADAGQSPAAGPLPIEPVAPPEPDLGPELVDPWGLEPAAARLSAGARRAGAVALGILTTLLVDGERVEAVVQGDYQHHAAVIALTRSRLLVVNDRHWVPDVRSILLDDQLVVQGWQDDRVATLAFAVGDRSVVVSGIVDRPLARDLARRARELSGGPDPSGAG